MQEDIKIKAALFLNAKILTLVVGLFSLFVSVILGFK